MTQKGSKDSKVYLLDKLLGGLHVHILAIAQGPTEEQCLLDSGSSCVSVKLFHVARHASKAGLLLGVAVDSDVTLNLTSCNTEAKSNKTPNVTTGHVVRTSEHKEGLLLIKSCFLMSSICRRTTLASVAHLQVLSLQSGEASADFCHHSRDIDAIALTTHLWLNALCYSDFKQTTRRRCDADSIRSSTQQSCIRLEPTMLRGGLHHIETHPGRQIYKRPEQKRQYLSFYQQAHP